MARRHGKSAIGWLAHWQFVNLLKDTTPIKSLNQSFPAREERNDVLCPFFSLGTFLSRVQIPSPCVPLHLSFLLPFMSSNRTHGAAASALRAAPGHANCALTSSTRWLSVLASGQPLPSFNHKYSLGLT